MFLFLIIGLIFFSMPESIADQSSRQLISDIRLPWQQGIEQLAEDEILVIKGMNLNQYPQIIVLRIDDQDSHDYYSRTNIERKIKSGPFELRIAARGLNKENKKKLDIHNLRRIFVFNANSHSGEKKTQINTISLSAEKKLPDYFMAFDFGTKRSEVLEGSQKVSIKTNNKLYSPVELFGKMNAIDRPGPDPWLRDGIAGIEELKIPLAQGLWRIVLFREDIGEWENLPRQMNLNIAINGVEQITQGLVKGIPITDPQSWYQRHYLRFYHHTANQDPWQEIISQRGLVQSFDIDHKADELSIRLLGDSPQQRFISGMIIQKLDEKVHRSSTNGLEIINRLREQYFKQHWLIENSPRPLVINGDRALRLAQGEGRLVHVNLDVAKGFARLHWQPTATELTASEYSGSDQYSFLATGGYKEVRQALPRWQRQGSEQHLIKRFRHLSSIADNTLASGKHRLAIWFKAGKEQAAGQYTAHLNIAFYPEAGSSQVESELVSFSIQVLGQKLVSSQQKVGVYLDHSPHLNFFEEWKTLQLAQVYCDLNYLDRLDLRALAPPMITPSEANIEQWLRQVALYQEFYGQADVLAYTPYKRMKGWLSGVDLSKKIGRLAQLSQENINLYWSIADEALPEQLEQIRKEAINLHYASQFAKTAGHLNHPNQRSLISELDLVLMNHGFGVKKTIIDQIHRSLSTDGKANKLVWLYNMPRYRLAAGAFLWHSAADAYVQWHGRMPTANPYDPTDGREGDYQFFYPQPTGCAALPDVDERLFDLAMGQYELAWYTWLGQQTGADAKALAQEIHQKLGGDWTVASNITEQELDHWRDQIIDLAQSLKQSDKTLAHEKPPSHLSGDSNEQATHRPEIY